MSFRKNSVNEILAQFDLQIKNEYKKAKGDKELCPSYWHKQLFVEAMGLEIKDWKIIRSGSYWSLFKGMSEIEQIKLKIEIIKNYKKKYDLL